LTVFNTLVDRGWCLDDGLPPKALFPLLAARIRVTIGGDIKAPILETRQQVAG
jgi:hypothetical protein